MSDRVQFWDVPDGSTLEIRCEADGSYQASAQIACEAHDNVSLSKSDVDPGPYTQEIQSPCIYIARINVQITGVNTTQVAVQWHLKRSDGTTHSSKKVSTLARADGRTHFAQCVVITELGS